MLRNYFRALFRQVRKQKIFFLINIAGLAIGLASSMLILLYVFHEWSYDRYHANAERIFRLTRAYDYPSGYDHHFARVPDTWINELEGAFPEVERLLRLQQMPAPNIRIGNKKFREEKAFVTDPYIFEVFSFPLLRGDPATVLARPGAIVLTESIADKYFPDQDPLGQTIEFMGDSPAAVQQYEVTGVMADLPAASHFDIHFLTSFGSADERRGWAYVYLLLREGADPAALVAGLPAFIDRHLDEDNASQYNRLHLQPLTSIHLHSHLARELQANGDRTTVRIFTLVAFFVLLLAGVNFVNLSIAQGARRSREIGMRKVLGAQRRQLVAFLLSESVLLALLAFLLALAIIWYLRPWFNRLTGVEPAFWRLPVLGFFLLVALLTGLLAGLYPAFRMTAIHPVAAIKDRGLLAPRRAWSLRKVLVVLQFSISIGLLICTGITWQQFQFLRQRKLGFDRDQVLAIPDIAGGVQRNYSTFKMAIEELPGVRGVSAAMDEPSQNIRDTGNVFAEGKTDDEDELVMDILPVDYDFTELMGIEMAAGEPFRQIADPAVFVFPDSSQNFFERINATQRSYLLNEAAVEAIGWASPAEALGKEFSWSNELLDLQRGPVIGVTKDFNFSSLHAAVRPLVMIYEPRFFGTILIKLDPQRVDRTLIALNERWDEQFPNYAFDYVFLDELFAQLYVAEQRQARVLGLFAGVALLIAALGVLGLTAIAARQRRREIGIRKIVGASILQVIGLLVREMLVLILIANIVAWPVAYLLMRRWLDGFAYHQQIAPHLFLLAGLLAILLALLAGGWHALRAALVNPAESVYHE